LSSSTVINYTYASSFVGAGGAPRCFAAAAVKCGGKKLRLPPRGAFVVVVVVVADKEHGTPTRSLRSRASPKALGEAKYRRGWRRQAQNIIPSRSLLPIGEGEVAGLAALAAVTLAL